MLKILATSLCLAVAVVPYLYQVDAQTHQDTDHAATTLYDSILMMDSILFTAINHHDLETVKTLFANDLEFYHDKEGLAGYDATIESIRLLFENHPTLRRSLVTEKTEVYPIPHVGALQTGTHRFCKQQNNILTDCGNFRFMHLWKRTTEGWKISRVFSYGHF